MALLASFWLKILFVFLKYSLNFQGHAQKYKLNKDWLANFIEFKYDRTNPQNEWAFEKTNKHMFLSSFCLKSLFHTFFMTLKKKLFHIWNLHIIYVFNNIFIRSWLLKKVAKNMIFLYFFTFYEPNLTA